jgi:alkanesulfonate monooxygenase SsuD/methylene tetrahydromethanopterin reductase-like flavin-dependent oxidoreductase (luciferase family)
VSIVKFGFVLPWGDARTAADLARLAEAHGWDGFFVWEPVWGVDAWVALAAAAMTTARIRLGTMLTPLPRRRPWDLAGQTAALDNLSNGRLILSVGLGAAHAGWLAFEPDPGRRVRAELLDEGLDVLTGLWAGQPFEYDGRHYQVTPSDFMPPPAPVQRPRIPIWVVGGWPAPRSMRRAARFDGWLPNAVGKGAAGPLAPEQVRAGAEWIRDLRTIEGLRVADESDADAAHAGAAGATAGAGSNTDGYDVICEGTTPHDDPAAGAELVRPWREAGATWWIESDWAQPREAVRDYAEQRLAAGPPNGQ